MALGCVALDVKHSVVRPKIVEEALALGLAVVTWTDNDPERAKLLGEWGVDTVIPDAVDRLSPR